MAQPYVGEIRLFAGNFNPAGWMFCEGQLVSIAENETLFQLIGTTYGGDGQETFALPDLRGRTPIHMGTGGGLSTRILAETAGTEEVTLTVQQTPAHTHPLLASGAPGSRNTPAGSLIAQSSTVKPYLNDTPGASMAATAITGVGGSQPHTNLQPRLAVNFIISLFGIFPSPS